MHAKGVVLCERTCFSAFAKCLLWKRSLLRTLPKTFCLRWKPLQAPSKNPSKKDLFLENLLRTLLRSARELFGSSWWGGGGDGMGGNRGSVTAWCPSVRDRQTPYRQRNMTPLVLFKEDQSCATFASQYGDDPQMANYIGPSCKKRVKTGPAISVATNQLHPEVIAAIQITSVRWRSYLRKAPDTFNFLRHVMRAILSVRPKCSHRCVSLKETPLKPVQILKHTTKKSIEQTVMRTKWFKHIEI